MIRSRKKTQGLVLELILFSMLWPMAAQAAQYYVSPSGNDSNNGSLNNPWQTLPYAFGRLVAGDVLYLRGGTYYLHDYYTSLKGTASAPITIQSYSGEHALVDGGLPDFKSTSTGGWELVNASLGLYRSKSSFSASFVRAWLLDYNAQIVEFSSAANMEATNYSLVSGFTPFYMGPGVQLRPDGHIYIRLQYNPYDLTDVSGSATSPSPGDTNPNKNRISIFTSEHILALVGAAYLHFKDIDFSYAKQIFDIRGGTHHIELDRCKLNFGSYGLVIRDNIHDWNVHDCEFNNGVPDYVYWTDVKNNSQEVAEAYPEFQSAAFAGPLVSFNIHNNVFRNTFDGLDVKLGSVNTTITDNTFKYVHDDGMELDTGISNVEVARNMFWHVGSGISIDGSSGTAGSVYIHHNVIDNSAYERGGRPGNYRQSDWPVWTTIDPFGSHDSSNNAAWWKVYNNTIVTRRSGYNWNASGPSAVTGNSEKYVYNNIFYVIDDRIILRDDQQSLGSHYDGDIFFRKVEGSFPFFYNFGNGGQYGSLADFNTKSGTKWEVHGLQIDPGFAVDVTDNPTLDPSTIWDRYRPTKSEAFTPGASYSGHNWPGTQDVNYRGAVPPSPSTTTPPVISAVTSSNLSANSATISWSTDKNSDSQVEYGTTTVYGNSTPLASTLATTHSVPLTGLQASTLYHYRVKSRDATAKLAVSPDFTFTTLAAPDTTAPVISGVTSSSITINSVTITWSTNEDSDSQVEYGLSTSYGSLSIVASTLMKTHSIDLNRLDSGTTYNYRVRSKDAAGNLVTSGNLIFVTLVADTTPPGDVENFTAVPGNSQVILGWNNPMDSDFKGVMIRYRTDGVFPTSKSDGLLAVNQTGRPGGSGSFVHSGLTNGKTYSYSAFTYDISQNYTSTAYAWATPANVSILSLTPNQGNTGTTVVIAGTGFGNTQSASTVTFNGLAATVSTWSNTSITTAVPSNATSGPVVVKANGVQSNGVTFLVGGRLPAPTGVRIKQ